jgi:hypothetical protein
VSILIAVCIALVACGVVQGTQALTYMRTIFVIRALDNTGVAGGFFALVGVSVSMVRL